MSESSDDYCAREVQRYDPDRWLTALFAPDAKRPALLALYAFNLEIARARETVSQPMIGQIRLQWWREAWDGIKQDRPRKHPVVEALHAHLRGFDAADAYVLIEGRERDMDPAPMPDMVSLLAYAEATSAPLMRLAAAALNAGTSAELQGTIRAAGTAYALIGILRATPFLVAQQRVLLPADRLRAAGLVPDSLHQKDHGAAVHRVIAEVAGEARRLLDEVGRSRVSRTALPALLPARLARVYLGQLERVNFDPEALQPVESATRKHIALIAAYLRRRI